jgi:glycosyltransferase involved in cell wall biosynthesis
MNQTKTTIVIPCFNEAERLPVDLFSGLIESYPNILFLFVNDGSSDSTLHVLSQLTAKKNVNILDLKQNVGKAEAVRKGVLHAINQINSDYIAFYDADMATPFHDIVGMIECISSNSYYMVAGCRFRRLGGNIQRSHSRFFMGRIFATFAAMILHLPVYDTQCGAKVLTKEVAKNIFTTQFVSKWLFDIELFARIITQYGYTAALNKIVEYPLSEWTDVKGSKLSIKEIIRQPLNLIKISQFYKLKNIPGVE